MPMTETVRDDGARMVTASRAAAELELRRGEFGLAVHLGIVRVDVRQVGGRVRVRQEEIDRLRSEDGFPQALRERVRTVGTAEGARLLGISPVRFTRLARAGCVTPVAFYLNRYRAVVWLYLAQELGGLAARSPELLVGNSPPWMRSRLDAGTDCRARNWRSRRIERRLTLTEDPWARAAVVAEALDPVQLAEVVDDPYERSYFGRIRPEPVFGQRGSAPGREAMAQLMLADEPDEILWRRVTLGMELDGARELRPAPRPGEERWPGAEVEAAAAAAGVPGASAEPAVPTGPTGPAGSRDASAERSQSVTPEGGGRVGAGRDRGGAPGLLARLRLRRTHGSRRPPRAVGGRGNPLATDTRARHSLHHVDQGSNR
ncbi:DUF6397 family protein [Streptomyces sp. NBC_01022]|uniref:DUF6397 family protein n=1 Tax=Streptomyces sp. NBC_01022 TaxID=2903723 RepID=UPI002DDA0C39|nr:DUF6397 family protein [Streptomyces sp. NBC_01022]WRZ78947.1 DUF6397 family protein [Streptomyces sp. NBC_01022]WRZ86732.1 DUF6397 family protein [Streptomyces sp. NBC_01022]